MTPDWVISEEVCVWVYEFASGTTMTLKDCYNKAKVESIATGLAKMHKASRKFKQQHPDLYETYESYNTIHKGMMDQFEKPKLP